MILGSSDGVGLQSRLEEGRAHLFSHTTPGPRRPWVRPCGSPGKKDAPFHPWKGTVGVGPEKPWGRPAVPSHALQALGVPAAGAGPGAAATACHDLAVLKVPMAHGGCCPLPPALTPSGER